MNGKYIKYTFSMKILGEDEHEIIHVLSTDEIPKKYAWIHAIEKFYEAYPDKTLTDLGMHLYEYIDVELLEDLQIMKEKYVDIKADVESTKGE